MKTTNKIENRFFIEILLIQSIRVEMLPLGFFCQLVGGVAVRTAHHRRAGYHLDVIHGECAAARFALHCVKIYTAWQVQLNGNISVILGTRWFSAGKPDNAKPHADAEDADNKPDDLSIRAEGSPNEQDSKKDYDRGEDIGNNFPG
jgi:hypothetical protein